MRNTNRMYISEIAGPKFIVDFSSLPEAQARTGRVKITRNSLDRAVQARNLVLGFDPDTGPQTQFNPPDTLVAVVAGARFGALGDTHLCSKYEALPELWKFYREMEALGISTVLHTGNFIDGDKYMTEVHTWGLDNQVDYFLNNYPHIPGITTLFVSGDDHEGWYYQQLGVDPGRLVVERQGEYGRGDLIYLGYQEADMHVPLEGGPDVHIKVMHPGGGSATSISLAAQKIIDNMTKTETPDVLLVGHYHKSHYLPNYRGCHAIQTGSFQHASLFMKKRNIFAAIGGWVVECSRGADDRLRVGATYLHYKPTPWRPNGKQG